MQGQKYHEGEILDKEPSAVRLLELHPQADV